MSARGPTIAAVTATVALSVALAWCSREQRYESDLPRYTPLQIPARAEPAASLGDDRTAFKLR